MEKTGKKYGWLIVLLVVMGLLPIFLYRFTIGSTPAVSVQEAAAAVDHHRALIIDVRDPVSFKKQHITGAVNWPFPQIMKSTPGETSRYPIDPSKYKDYSFYVTCYSGISSTFASKHLVKLGWENIASITGGMQEWQSTPWQPPRKEETIYKKTSLIGQIILSVSAFGMKPLYMIASFLLFLLLWQSKLPDLVALRWAMFSFFAGEAACAVNFLFFHEDSYLVEYLHMFGMVCAFGFTTYALLEAMDIHVIHYSDKDKKCSLWKLCPACWKSSTTRCAAERMFQFLIPVCIIIACLPLLAKPQPLGYHTHILGTPYQSIHPVIYQIFEIRFAPLAAIILFIAAQFILARKKDTTFALAQALFACGMGFLGFSLFRLVLFGVFQDDLVWFAAWEEITELLYVLGAVYITWLFHRKEMKLWFLTSRNQNTKTTT